MKLFTIIKEDSSRIKNKNFQDISPGIPLWRWTTNNLISEDNTIYINTDSKKLLDTKSNESNIFFIPRHPKHIDWEKNSALMGSPVEDMFKEFCIDYATDSREIVCLFHVTSPFISLSTIKNAANFLYKGFDSVQSVKRIQDFLFFQDKNTIVPLNFSPEIVQRTQDLRPAYLSLGAFFISRAGDVIQTGKRLPGKCFNFELDALESIEIDEYDQLKLSRMIANSKYDMNHEIDI